MIQVINWERLAAFPPLPMPPKWDFVAPEAILYVDEGGNGVVGIHYGGPTWESPGGSRVIGEVVDRCTRNPDAIDWLLLRGKASGGPGIFNGVTFIQRINTVGGKAPAEAGDFVGEVARACRTRRSTTFIARPDSNEWNMMRKT